MSRTEDISRLYLELQKCRRELLKLGKCPLKAEGIFLPFGFLLKYGVDYYLEGSFSRFEVEVINNDKPSGILYSKIFHSLLHDKRFKEYTEEHLVLFGLVNQYYNVVELIYIDKINYHKSHNFVVISFKHFGFIFEDGEFSKLSQFGDFDSIISEVDDDGFCFIPIVVKEDNGYIHGIDFPIYLGEYYSDFKLNDDDKVQGYLNRCSRTWLSNRAPKIHLSNISLRMSGFSKKFNFDNFQDLY